MYICTCTKPARQALWAAPALAQQTVTLLGLPRSLVCCMHSDVVPMDYCPVVGVLEALLLAVHVHRASFLFLLC